MTKPLISVLMPVWNGEDFIKPAVSSLLRQSHREVELIIVDDCSTDRTFSILSEFKDSRIRLFRLKENAGSAAALSFGLGQVSGDWIARQDADDLSHPLRLSLQLGAAKTLGERHVIGTAAVLIGEARGLVSKRVTHGQLYSQLFFQSPFIHSSVFAHRETFTAHPYDPRFIHVEDYDFIERAVLGGLRLFNLPAPLVKYRVHKEMKSKDGGKSGMIERRILRERVLSHLQISPSAQQAEIHFALAARNAKNLDGKVGPGEVQDWARLLVSRNDDLRIVPRRAFRRTISQRAKILSSLL